MTDATTDDAAEDAAGRLRSKNGVPKADLATIDSQAQKIWAAARKGDVAPVIIARALTGKDDSKASGGTWATRIGALRLYNVVEKGNGNTFKMTDLGIALSNTTDTEAHARALKDAILGIPAYAAVLGRFDGGSLPDVGIIASEYEYGYELSKSDATSAAKQFVESAKYAGFVNESGAVNLGGLVIPPVDEESAASPASQKPPAATRPAPKTPASATPAASAVPAPPAPAVVTLATPASAPVALTVKLDMSGWPVKDVLSVLSALGYKSASDDRE